MPLDYIGKFVIVLIAVAVGAGIIMSTQSNVEDVLPEFGDGNDIPEDEIVDIDGNKAQQIADHVNLCYSASREKRHESFTCFMARSKTGSFSLSPGDITPHMSVDTSNVEFRPGGDNTFNRETIIIRYSVSTESVVVEE